ncbi:MAG TPA: hypothetical protein VFV25_05440 [Methylibium sp.]
MDVQSLIWLNPTVISENTEISRRPVDESQVQSALAWEGVPFIAIIRRSGGLDRPSKEAMTAFIAESEHE